MTVRMLIDFAKGILEVEGEADLVREVYADFREQFRAAAQRPPAPAPPGEGHHLHCHPLPEAPARPAAGSRRNSAPQRRRAAPHPNLLADLDLGGQGDLPGLSGFLEGFAAKNDSDRTLLFVYYLERVRGIAPVGRDHVYTCYEAVPGFKVPTNLSQNIRNCRDRTHGIAYDHLDEIRLTLTGVNRVEHELKKGE